MNTTFVNAICFLHKMVSFTFKGRVNRTARPLFRAVTDYFFCSPTGQTDVKLSVPIAQRFPFCFLLQGTSCIIY